MHLLPPANEVWVKVIFLHLSVILFTGGGACSGGYLLPGGVPAPGGMPAPGVGAWWRPPQTATAAGGTHPTGMHSCFFVGFFF